MLAMHFVNILWIVIVLGIYFHPTISAEVSEKHLVDDILLNTQAEILSSDNNSRSKRQVCPPWNINCRPRRRRPHGAPGWLMMRQRQMNNPKTFRNNGPRKAGESPHANGVGRGPGRGEGGHHHGEGGGHHGGRGGHHGGGGGGRGGHGGHGGGRGGHGGHGGGHHGGGHGGHGGGHGGRG